MQFLFSSVRSTPQVHLLSQFLLIIRTAYILPKESHSSEMTPGVFASVEASVRRSVFVTLSCYSNPSLIFKVELQNEASTPKGEMD